jgi:RNA polymerase sigma factor (sigma-70 family)
MIRMEDVDLIAQVKNGNTNAFRFLVDKYKNLVWHMVLRMINQQEDAEDICQDVFMRVFRDIGKFRGESKLSTWIGTIAYNTCIDHLRKKGREKTYATDNLGKILAGKISMDSASSRVDKSYLKNIVHKIIEAMPVHYRTVITLYHLEEMSYREMEEITGMPEGTIKSYLNRSRQILREKIIQMVPDIEPVLFNTD